MRRVPSSLSYQHQGNGPRNASARSKAIAQALRTRGLSLNLRCPPRAPGPPPSKPPKPPPQASAPSSPAVATAPSTKSCRASLPPELTLASFPSATPTPSPAPQPFPSTPLHAALQQLDYQPGAVPSAKSPSGPPPTIASRYFLSSGEPPAPTAFSTNHLPSTNTAWAASITPGARLPPTTSRPQITHTLAPPSPPDRPSSPCRPALQATSIGLSAPSSVAPPSNTPTYALSLLSFLRPAFPSPAWFALNWAALHRLIGPQPAQP